MSLEARPSDLQALAIFRECLRLGSGLGFQFCRRAD
jgi:hypothetical protein